MTDQTAPKPLVARAAAAVVAAPGAVKDWFSTLSPAINACIVVVVTAAVTFGSTMATQHYLKPAAKLSMPVALPDLPKPAPTPMVSVADVDHALGLHCGKVEGKLDVLLERTAPKGSVKKTAG